MYNLNPDEGLNALSDEQLEAIYVSLIQRYKEVNQEIHKLEQLQLEEGYIEIPTENTSSNRYGCRKRTGTLWKF